MARFSDAAPTGGDYAASFRLGPAFLVLQPRPFPRWKIFREPVVGRSDCFIGARSKPRVPTAVCGVIMRRIHALPARHTSPAPERGPKRSGARLSLGCGLASTERYVPFSRW
jgi:hypothetical protein